MPDPILQVTGIDKSFWGIQALVGVSLQVYAGEVHAVTGENGAGKSTLMKIIAGQERADSGDVHFRGRAIAMIHQELLPFPDLTIAENIFMGQEPVHWIPGWVDRGTRDRRARELLAQLGLALDPRSRMGHLTVAEKQSVEIAKALERRADLLIMDEPTSALSERESELLFRIIADLKSRGASILYISHRMQEIFRLADTITVMRDGRHIATCPAAELDENRLIGLMVGRSLEAFAEKSSSTSGEAVLEVRGLSRFPRFHDVSFTLRRGEILGLAGLMGAGRTDVAAAIFGLAPATCGDVFVHGRRISVRSPATALANGIAMVTEDRKEFGFVPNMSVRENITLSSLDRFSWGPFLRPRAEAIAAGEQMRQLDVRAAGSGQAVKFLSGGNQQKVALARALLANPQVLILDEPTRGIDVRAKAGIHALISGLARAGKAILLISSEMNEILSLSDRIVVMRAGAAVAELLPAATTPEEILQYAMPKNGTEPVKPLTLESAGSAESSPQMRSKRHKPWPAEFTLAIALAVLMAALSLAKPNFLNVANLVNLVRQISINGILAVGVTYVLLTGGVDLSLGSVVALTGVVAASFAHPGQYAVLVPVFMGILVGAASGAVNGVIVTRGRVAPFIATLGTMTAARGLALLLSGGRPVSNLSEPFTRIGGGSIASVPVPIVVFAAVACLSWVFLGNMRMGRYIYAVGGNESAARASGVHVHSVKMAAYTLCGAFAGLAGVVLASRITTGQPNAGIGYELDAIAAVVIGGTSLNGGIGGVGGAILGALLIGVINNGLDLLNISSYYQQLVKGLIIVGAVWLDRRKERT